MKTQDFLDLLQEHQDKSLLFEYAPNLLVGANYHITEVKNITVDSVDCGAGVDFWKETIIQLWESPSELGKTTYMTSYKALAILKKVDRIKPMVKDAELKFEYGNATFHTTNLYAIGHHISENKLIITLSTYKTDCKAKEVCGIPEPSQEMSSNCNPASGCC